jgi:hypothetical protein
MDSTIDKVNQLFTAGAGQIPILELVTNLLIAIFLAILVKETYKTCGRSLSYRSHLASTFIMFVLSTTLIITVVKSSLALSLGLVGALSVVRFRTPIKEPEELMYLFFCIGIGLGLGAGQRLVTIVGAAVILSTIWIRHLTRKDREEQKLKLAIFYEGESKPSVESINSLLETHALLLDLRRLDESGDRLELGYDVEFESLEEVNQFRAKLTALDRSIRLTLFDDRGLLQT